MPELPEIEYAATIARRAAIGRTIAEVEVRHAAQARHLPDEARAALAGDEVASVQRRGKHQLLRLASGRVLHVHFRMTGDWVEVAAGESIPRHARMVITFTDGSALALDDSRALSVVRLAAADEDSALALGPEANDPTFTPAHLARTLAKRRGPIKPVLLDQRVVAGLGNIYAVEALWYARIDPRLAANSLSPARVRRLHAGIRRALAKALAGAERYYGAGESAGRFNVYDREGKACRRCRKAVRRVVQAGRSTYFCGGCQR
jgi:formamidopyrimidine-DNA glycosylase